MESKKKLAIENLAAFKSEIDKELINYFDNEIERVDEIYNNEYSIEVLNTVKEFTCRGGKRLRGAFVYNTYFMMGGTDREVAMNAAMAIEIIHAYLLIEDDFMDLSDRRRGDPTAHKMLEEYHQENFSKGDSAHIGASLALLGSLMASHLAMELINSLDIDNEILRKVNLNLNQRLNVTVQGQINDVVNELRDDVSEEDIFNVLHWKTAAYTYENPIHVGAILAGASDKELEDLSKFAIPAGIAFQIQDDILGVFGDSDKTGKSNMDDLMEGKMTLLIYYALQNGSKEQTDQIKKALGNREITPKEHNEIQEIIIDTGSLDYSKEKALKFVQEAKADLYEIRRENWQEDGFNSLVGIADFMIERDL